MLRAGTEWCSLCYADLRPREEPALRSPADLDVATVEPIDQAEVAEPDSVAVAASVGVRPTPSGGKHARRPTSTALGAVTAPTDEVERLAVQLLAELAATEGGSPLGVASGLVDSPGKRVALVVGAGLAILLLLIVVMAVAGAFL